MGQELAVRVARHRCTSHATCGACDVHDSVRIERLDALSFGFRIEVGRHESKMRIGGLVCSLHRQTFVRCKPPLLSRYESGGGRRKRGSRCASKDARWSPVLSVFRLWVAKEAPPSHIRRFIGMENRGAGPSENLTGAELKMEMASRSTTASAVQQIGRWKSS